MTINTSIGSWPITAFPHLRLSKRRWPSKRYRSDTARMVEYQNCDGNEYEILVHVGLEPCDGTHVAMSGMSLGEMMVNKRPDGWQGETHNQQY